MHNFSFVTPKIMKLIIHCPLAHIVYSGFELTGASTTNGQAYFFAYSVYGHDSTFDLES